MTSNKFLILACVLACVLRPDTLIAQNVSPEMAKLVDARDDQRCQKLGAVPNTEVYINCRLKLQEMAQRQWAAQNLEMQQQEDAQAALNQNLIKLGIDLMAPPVAPVTPQFSKTTNCTSEIIYGRLQTVCRQF